ncbi:TIGR04086 family membrane protein [Clostridium cellulovorans]|uniref:TIGR04086 family membrane protein n=1 Tax=Clostridium cellulovorans (strain ATCC 35296 / DSM 3052 / OCM 3 / 743B) TaxID=573061 RepID=D9SMV5_CLOC7|nr:TIGR04086 family membrane protein [Clostridium cellulovorans]ADL51821.1 hypothetical protein Clocel_2078 [Clostridium cellulovorans 743B]
MNYRILLSSCGKGVVRSFFLTLLLILFLAIISTFTELGAPIRSAAILITTLLSIVYGAIYSAKKTGEKGWLHGLIVAALYMIILYIVATIGGRNLALNINDALRVLLALVVGFLSGMLGMNI